MAAMIFKETAQLCRREYETSIKEAITSWRDNGFSQQYIADRLGVSAITVRKWAKRYEITFDRSKYNAVCRGTTKGMTLTRRAS